MNTTKFNETLTGNLRCLSSWDLKLSLGVISLVTAAIAFQVVYSVGYVNGREALAVALSAIGPPGVYTNFDFLHWLNILHVGIALGYIMATLGLWSRRAFGFFFSILGLLSVCIVYVWWYQGTQHFLKNSEVTEYTKLHDPFFTEMGMLRGASWWDLLVLLVAMMLLLWQLKTLLGITRSVKNKPGPET